MACALKIQCDFILNVKVTVFIYLFIYFADTKRYRTCWCNRDGICSVSHKAYKSQWYTARRAVSKTVSLIYVIGNLSNTIFLNCICFSPSSKARVSDDWGWGGSGSELHGLTVSPPPPPIADWAWEGPICQGVRLDHIWRIPPRRLQEVICQGK